MTWWVHELWQDGQVALLLSQIFWVIFSVTLHELAHGWAALRQGDDTPRRLKRMTMNPLVHMGPWSLVAFAMIGIAWGAMPVDPSRFRSGRTGRLLVAAAGPAMNASLAFVALTLLGIWVAVGPVDHPIHEHLEIFLLAGGWVNMVLALFNMLPIPPLDGSTILASLSRRVAQLYERPEAAMAGLFVVMVLMVSGIPSLVFGGCAFLADGYVYRVAEVVGGIAGQGG